MENNGKLYFAQRDGKELSNILDTKISEWYNCVNGNGYLGKLKDCYAFYYGASYDSAQDAHRINFGGEQGELASIFVNHIRNLGQHMLMMTVGTRPAMDARAANGDYKSLAQTTLANGLLDYYMREKRMERYIRNAVEMAIVLGSGYVKMEWDANVGRVVEKDEESGLVIREGDVKFTNVSPFDVIVDPYKESTDHDWMIVRTYKNRFDLIALYPEFEDKIRSVQTKQELENSSMKPFGRIDTDDIPIWTFYHKRTPAMPEGREMVYVCDNAVLLDQALPYARIPIYRVAANEIMGTPFGYSSLFDLLPLQEAVNQMYSTALTNNIAFGVQNIFVKQGSNLQTTQLAGGLNVIEGLEKPEILQLEGTSATTLQLMTIFQKEMEVISGISSVTRGNVSNETNLRSGNAMALLQAMSIQFMSGLQQQYVQLIEDLGTGLIEILKDYAQAPRVISIVGKGHRAELKEFKSSDLSEINRVIVDVANPLSRTMAGRVQMAEQLMQMKPEEFSIQQYIQVINTGRLDIMTDDAVDEENLIADENEMMIRGEEPVMLVTDLHLNHIKQHRKVLASPSFRTRSPENERIKSVTLTHIQEHLDALSNANPELLQALNQPVFSSQQQQATPAQEQANSLGEDSAAPELMKSPNQVAGDALPSIPSPSTPPAPFKGLPVIPGEQ